MSEVEPMPSRPKGFPRAAWAALQTPDQADAAHQRWTAVRGRDEALAWRIVAEVIGRPLDDLWQTKQACASGAQTKRSRVVVNCDGLCEPVNPGGTATYGFVARRGPELLTEDCGVVAKGPAATNNLAEYTAVIKALEWAVEALATGEPVTIRTDSQLVVNQVNGEWAVPSPNIRPLCKAARLLLSKLCQGHSARLEWVPRERNQEADRLTRAAYASADKEGAAARAERAKALLGAVEASDEPGHYRVRSSSGRGYYMVDLGEGTCTCPDFVRRRSKCKHLIAAEEVAAGTVTTPYPMIHCHI